MVRRSLCAALTIAVTMLVSVSPAAAFEWLGQYGIGFPGGGSGQLTVPMGVDVSPDGTVAAADVGNSRVAVFTQAGRFLRAFGKDVSAGGGTGAEICTTDCKPGEGGSAAGELAAPWGVAVGANEIYVAEIGNARVSVFDLQGNFLRAFGADVGGPGVNLCTSTCSVGTAGAEAGQMAAPGGVALDAGGRLFVTQLGTSRVEVYDPVTGQFQRAFGKNVGGAGVNTCTTSCFAGVADESPGSINAAYSLAIAANGEVFVAEAATDRVSVFTAEGGFLRLFGSEGEGAGQLKEPYGVALDSTGNVYVGDTGNNRVATFGTQGDFRNARGLDVVPGAPVGAEVCTAACKAGESGFGIGEFSSPRDIASDCRDAVYVAMVGRVDKWGEAAARVPPCPSNAFTIGKTRRNKKKGTLTVEVTVSGPGSLLASVPRKMKATVPQPGAAGALLVRVKAAGKGLKTLKRKGKLKGNLTLTFTPPNGDPNTQSKKVKLIKKLKKRKRKAKGKGGKRGR